MDGFQERMMDISENLQHADDVSRVAQIQSAMLTQQTQKRMSELLLDLGREWGQRDEWVRVEFSGGSSESGASINPGLDVTYGGEGGTWSSPTFSIATVCNADRVEVTVSDGHWDSVANVHGNWGTWTDQRLVYQGDVRTPVIRRRLQEAFLPWYKEVVTHGYSS